MKTTITVDISFFTLNSANGQTPQTREVMVEHFFLTSIDDHVSIILS